MKHQLLCLVCYAVIAASVALPVEDEPREFSVDNVPSSELPATNRHLVRKARLIGGLGGAGLVGGVGIIGGVGLVGGGLGVPPIGIGGPGN